MKRRKISVSADQRLRFAILTSARLYEEVVTSNVPGRLLRRTRWNSDSFHSTQVTVHFERSTVTYSSGKVFKTRLHTYPFSTATIQALVIISFLYLSVTMTR